MPRSRTSRKIGTHPLAAVRSAFSLGHTDEDVRRVLAKASQLIHLHLVVVWDFRDRWGCGGNSELMVLGEGGRFFECPGIIYDYLYCGNGEPDQLPGLSPGPGLRGKRPVRIDEFNYARRDAPDAELD